MLALQAHKSLTPCHTPAAGMWLHSCGLSSCCPMIPGQLLAQQQLRLTVPLLQLACRSSHSGLSCLVLAPQAPGPFDAQSSVADTQTSIHTKECPSLRKELEGSSTWRYNRLHWSETVHGRTDIPISKLFMSSWPFYPFCLLSSPHLFLRSPKFFLFSTFSSFLKYPIISLFPCIL